MVKTAKNFQHHCEIPGPVPGFGKLGFQPAGRLETHAQGSVTVSRDFFG